MADDEDDSFDPIEMAKKSAKRKYVLAAIALAALLAYEYEKKNRGRA